MKNSVFVWTPLVLFALLTLVPLVVDYPVPFSGAIFLLGCSISGYAGIKSIGIFLTAKELPSGEGITPNTRKKLQHILIALYVVILEVLIVSYIKSSVELPVDDLFTMAGVCSAIVLGGDQAIKLGQGLAPKKIGDK